MSHTGIELDKMSEIINIRRTSYSAVVINVLIYFDMIFVFAILVSEIKFLYAYVDNSNI